MALNPFDQADKIEIGHNNDTGYYVYIQNIGCNVHLNMGAAITAALFMKANHVDHFDYSTHLFNDTYHTLEFIAAAGTVGFAI